MKNIEIKPAKRLALSLLAVFIFGAGAFSANVSAQTANVFEIQIPFDFFVKGRTYESGTYRVGRLNQANPDMLVLKNSDDKTLLVLLTQRHTAGTPERLSKMSFRRYGEMYFLDSVRASGESHESRIPAFKSDRQRRGAAWLSEIVAITGK